MGITDLFRPKYRHSDVRVRTEAVRAMTADDAAVLTQVARTDRDIGVRRLAIAKIEEAEVLADIAAAESERSLRDYAGERAAELWAQIACGDDADDASAALAGIMKLGDQQALVEVVVDASLPALRKRAFGEVRDPRALADLAKSEAPHEIRLAAVGRIDDGDVLRALAIDTTLKEVGLAAVDKLDDAERLENVAQKAKNKAVRQRARKIATEINEAERKRTPGVPDEVKRRRAEKAQLIRQVEAVADAFDFDKLAPSVKAAEAAWAEVGGGGEDGDDRFGKAVERFWKRKQLHDQQARTADELRVVEREAKAEKDRAAAERAAATPAPVVTPVAETDAAREAREAEAKLRAEERERKRVEDETRRTAEAAEREARKKDDAERAVAIAASLRALCDDMEALAAAGGKDGKAIDRLLQQAGRAFDQIGKVASTERDAIADRYQAVRGKLVIRISELREAEDWERWANVPKAEALIATAKAMAEAPATPDLGDRLRQLQALWKEVGAMPQRRSKELWELFKSTCDQVYEKVRGVRAVEAEKFDEVTKVKEALIAEAEGIAASFDPANADKLKALQAKWKDSGHLPRKLGDELWKRFRAACDKFFEQRKPLLDARHSEEADNLAKKQALITRAQQVVDGAPGPGGWGKAIGQIKDLQAEWKEVGYVPRRDADAVYKAFRAACDALFAKRDGARDAEADAHRAVIDDIKGEIADVLAGGDDVIAAALAVRAKVAELGNHELSERVVAMTKQVIAANPEAVKGTELDPTTIRARRDKLIAKVVALMPKAEAPVSTEGNPAEVAAKLREAMRKNAFGELRWSGRDPIEVIDELRGQIADAGPMLDDTDQAQLDAFEAACAKVIEAVGSRRDQPASEPRRERDEGGEGRRRRRDRRSAEQPVVAAAAPQTETPTLVHDAITAPAKLPFEPLPPPPAPVVVAPPSQPPRPKSMSTLPPMDELDTAWDLDAPDPTAKADEAAKSPPSSSEMAGDSATGGDGIDEPGWD